jgi:hypothetical protein
MQSAAQVVVEKDEELLARAVNEGVLTGQEAEMVRPIDFENAGVTAYASSS